MNSDFSSDTEFLSGETRIERRQDGVLALIARGVRTEGIRVRPAFPLTRSDQMVVFVNGEGDHVGTIVDYSAMDKDSVRLVEEELRNETFRPVIQKILSLRKHFGLVEMRIETNAGPHLVRIHSPRDDLRQLEPGRYLVTDAAGNRYEISDVTRLDETSRALWHNLV